MRVTYFDELNTGLQLKDDGCGKPTQDGYGSKIKTDYMIKSNTTNWLRVYAVCFSNVASFYVVVRGAKQYIHDYVLDELRDKLK